MGGTHSSNTSHDIKIIAVDIITKNSSTCQTDANNTFNVIIDNTDKVNGTVNFDNLDLNQYSSANVKCVADSMLTNNLDNQIKTKVEQYANSKGQAILSAISGTRADVLNDFQSNLKTTIKNTSSSDNIAKISNAFNLNVKNSNLNLTNSTINQSLKTVIETILHTKEWSDLIQSTATKLDQTTVAVDANPIADIFKSIGDMLGKPLVLLIIGLVIGFLIITLSPAIIQKLLSRKR